MSAPARVSSGTPAGGEFAVTAKAEPDVQLSPGRDKDGFPTVACSRCGGTGRSKYSTDYDHSRCLVCGGTGRHYSSGRVMDALKAYAKAQVSASRPRVRQLHAGDVVSRVYRTPGEADWKKVASVLVFPGATARSATPAGPGELVAVVQFVDGTHIQVTTDTVVARRGAVVDPEPFVAQAEGRRAVRKVSRRR